MKEFLLKFPIIYRFYQNTVRKKNHEYDFFKYFFKKVCKKKIRVLDLCCGDSYILDYVENYIDDYMGYDNNPFYLNQNKKKWKKFKFIYGDLKNLKKNEKIFKFKPNLIFMNGAIHHLDNELVKMINEVIRKKFNKAMFISVDPLKNKNKMINRLMINLDRGKFIRKRYEYKKIMKIHNSFITDDFYKMSFLNIFHYRNIKLQDFYSKWKSTLLN
tara:strand:- start:3021 stop:3665 length:645 start_codon:yes stop_codon:yes gene_type:complete